MQQASRPRIEARAVIETFAARGLPTTTFTEKRLRRRQLELDRSWLVAGDLDSVPLALRQLGVTPASLPTYPDALHDHLGRRIWRSTVQEVRGRHDAAAVFVKPAERDKRFTGFVRHDPSDDFQFAGASGQTAVWCAEVVQFDTEYRAYVVNGMVRGICPYRGDGPPPPSDLLMEWIDALAAHGSLVAGFGLDVGRRDGTWAVVECNDGLGLGLYEGLDFADYTDLLVARWAELVA